MKKYPRLVKLEAIAQEAGVEVFHLNRTSALDARREARKNHGEKWRDHVGPLTAGWYWWICFPGCLPEGDASGPHKSYTKAMRAWYDTTD
ncbi:MAG: hypothetical protein ACRC2H_01110 [Silanimonas sp.]